MDHRQWQIEIAHEWRDKHNLPRLSDNEAQQRYWGVEAMPDKAKPVNRRRMNTSEHIQRLLRVWELWKQQPKKR